MQHAASLRYGLLGLPLAFVALPLYVHLPHVYANRYGMPLATLGAVLLLARLFDAFTDPLLGRLGDRLQARSGRHVLVTCALAALVLLAGMALLFFPPWARPEAPATLLAVLVLTCTAYSLLAIAHQSWGARLGGDELQRTRIVAWREGAGLVGVVLASVLPSWLGWGEWLAVFALALALGWLAWWRGPAPAPVALAAAHPWRQDLLHPWRHAPFRRLMGVFVLNGLASAVPATLVLFFIQDRLQAPAQEPLFLATYFVAAAASMPLWLRVVARLGLARSWLAGMLLSVAVFAWAAQLGPGDVTAFWWVCALSGLALGTDLALPGALLAGMIAERGDRGQREGAYFGWWNLAAKLNLALAAGLALPLLELLGYRPGSASPEGLQALTLAYAVLPCALKLLAAAGLYLALARAASPPSSPTPLTEAP
jgi:GPH family glycoside/pentoside/hexuronide:cation symporter